MPSICLNLIVKNENDRILRALESARPYINTFFILDTGSTDGTQDTIRAWASDRGIPGLVAQGMFVNFSQARNEALCGARSWRRHPHAPPFDYILLMDADMELVVEKPSAFDGLQGDAYEMVQFGGGIRYNNTRLIRADAPGEYVGVTHEYLSCNVAGVIDGAHFTDHADGSNRVNKFERDIALLCEDLKRDDKNSRTWFYLGQSYRDCGEWTRAENAYRRCVELATWHEEKWNAQLNVAHMRKAQGDKAGFMLEALTAYDMRPTRGEALYDLAQFCREEGKNGLATLFASHGLTMKRPDDKLFNADYVYDWGFREEFAIAGYYQSETRPRAAEVSMALAVDANVPEGVRWRNRRDMVFYLPRLDDVCPSTNACRIMAPTIKEGFVSMNPCITNRPGSGFEVLLRTVNYRIDAEGRYMIGPLGCNDAPIITENYLLEYTDDLRLLPHIVPVTWVRDAAKFPLVIGLEDMRIFWKDGSRQFYANVRESREDGACVQHRGFLRGDGLVVDIQALSDPVRTEKNWVPFLYGGAVHEFVYRLDTLGELHPDGTTQFEKFNRYHLAVENISGSSQWIRFRGGMLAVVHESIHHPTTGKRVYQHRFAYTTVAFDGLKLSKPFVFHDVQIEFAAGIAHGPGDTIVASYGVRDEQAWLAHISGKEIECLLGL